MLQDAQRTSAPRWVSVSISTAVWIVMCSEPAMRAPRSGCSGPNSSRVAIKPGISVSAMAISLRPQSAKPMSLTTWSAAGAVFFLVAVMAILVWSRLARPAPTSSREAIAGVRPRGNKDIKISLYAFPPDFSDEKGARLTAGISSCLMSDDFCRRGHATAGGGRPRRCPAQSRRPATRRHKGGCQ